MEMVVKGCDDGGDDVCMVDDSGDGDGSEGV